MRGSQKGNEEQLLPRKWPQAPGEAGVEQSCRGKGSRGAGMARCSQETPQSGMNLFLGTVLLLLLLPGEWQVKGGQAQEVYGLCGKVSPWEGVHQKNLWGFHLKCGQARGHHPHWDVQR